MKVVKHDPVASLFNLTYRKKPSDKSKLILLEISLDDNYAGGNWGKDES